MSLIPRHATLLILDGWNLGEAIETNASYMARTPNLDRLMEKYPWTWIKTSGLEAGLPEGQMGNSEVGHMNLGAGRIVDQDITRINKAVENGEIGSNPVWNQLLEETAGRGGTLHLLGLVSDGGVHSSIVHLEALLPLAAERGLPVRLHAFMDGRDTSPRSGAGFLRRIEELGTRLKSGGADFAVATVGGRYWGMDRDHRWERIEHHWRAIIEGRGPKAVDPVAAVERSYADDVTDEFVKPTVIVDEAGKPLGPIRDGDGIFFFNFRADRIRQISRAIADPNFKSFVRSHQHDLACATMTEYDRKVPIPHAFLPRKLDGIFADVLTAGGLRNLRMAETEKYAHVTFFFNGGVEEPWRGEDRILIPSPKVPTYDLLPEMSLPELSETLIDRIENDDHDFRVVNFANCDMVGHTGDFKAAVQAVETVDHAVGKVVEAILDTGGYLLLTADHGNVEQMWDPVSEGPHTQHTVEPVPLVLIDPTFSGELRPGRLADVIPTLLARAELFPSSEMTGRDLCRD